MKRAAVPCLAMLALVLGQPRITKAEDVTQELTMIQRQWRLGELKKDTAVFERVCADDYTQGTRTGQVLTKREWLRELKNPNWRLTEYRTDSMHVRVLGSGTVAIETVHLTLAGETGGKPWHTVIRGVRVFEKKDGHWRALLTQFSPPLKSSASIP